MLPITLEFVLLETKWLAVVSVEVFVVEVNQSHVERFLVAAMQPLIPAEILRQIVRIATEIPRMLDTSSPEPFDTSSGGQALEMAVTATEMFTFKSNLSRVSKLFNAVTEEFMYEYIVLYDLEQLFPLLRSLDTLLRSTEHKVFRGERCKRLDIAFGRRAPRKMLYEMDQQLLWVYHGIGKLFLACPNMQVLTIHFGTFLTPTDVGVSDSLWMHIASRLRSLRVLSVSSVLIYEGDVPRLLNSLQSLERLRITVSEWRDRSVPPPIRTVRLFRPDELAQCLFALQSTQWPDTCPKMVIVPNLRSLEIVGGLYGFMKRLELPALRTVIIPSRAGEKYCTSLEKWKYQVTHLVLSCEGEYPGMWEALHMFPRVQDLTVMRFDPYLDNVDHPYLQVIRLHSFHMQMSNSLTRLLDGGKLTGLREIVLLETYQSIIDEQMSMVVEGFAKRGVQLRSGHPAM
ncbi:hypothetical protein FRC17_008825 [Serendipita sp. 399]|nr:hypothetical protein FRC17_008825 [Serendipita sp. 399]